MQPLEAKCEFRSNRSRKFSNQYRTELISPLHRQDNCRFLPGKRSRFHGDLYRLFQHSSTNLTKMNSKLSTFFLLLNGLYNLIF